MGRGVDDRLMQIKIVSERACSLRMPNDSVPAERTWPKAKAIDSTGKYRMTQQTVFIDQEAEAVSAALVRTIEHGRPCTTFIRSEAKGEGDPPWVIV